MSIASVTPPHALVLLGDGKGVGEEQLVGPTVTIILLTGISIMSWII